MRQGAAAPTPAHTRGVGGALPTHTYNHTHLGPHTHHPNLQEEEGHQPYPPMQGIMQGGHTGGRRVSNGTAPGNGI